MQEFARGQSHCFACGAPQTDGKQHNVTHRETCHAKAKQQETLFSFTLFLPDLWVKRINGISQIFDYMYIAIALFWYAGPGKCETPGCKIEPR